MTEQPAGAIMKLRLAVMTVLMLAACGGQAQPLSPQATEGIVDWLAAQSREHPQGEFMVQARSCGVAWAGGRTVAEPGHCNTFAFDMAHRLRQAGIADLDPRQVRQPAIGTTFLDEDATPSPGPGEVR
jgi:hypothetical protein